ncbi:MAG: hypothetical protein JSS65_03065 [Armatimonadetes bacterium]|nr:hypothetical protein [Armatimonadota bacterium]
MRVKLRTRQLGLALMALAAVVSQAQVGTSIPTGSTAAVGGKHAYDLVRLRAGSMVVPLRQGHLVPNSETVDLDGRTLGRDKDYSIDYAAGSLVLRVQYTDGQSLRVSYRYDDTQKSTGVFVHGGGASNFSGFTFDFTGGTKAVFGLGLAERTEGGTLMASNIYGLANSFKLSGGGSLSGLFMVGDRHREDSRNLFDGSKSQEKVEEGQGTAIVQKLASKVLGGEFTANYQDIDDRFGGFQSFASAGYSQADIDALAKEKGLKRSAFRLTDVKAGGLKLSGGVQSVGDDTGGVSWRNYGLGLGGFSFTWDSRAVDPTFNRFASLREEDRNQLAKERGLTFGNIGAKQLFKNGALEYMDARSEDQNGTGLFRRSLGFNLGTTKAYFNDRKVTAGFSRLNDLRDPDRGQLLHEIGMARQSFGFESAFMKGWNLTYANNKLASDAGDAKAVDFALVNPKWSLERGSRTADKGFSSFGAFAPQETQAYVNSILGAVAGGPAQGPDMGAFGYSAGLERNWWKFGLDLGKGSKLGYRTYNLSSQTGAADLSAFTFDSAKYKFSFSQQGVSDTFGSASQLLPTEQRALGVADGLQKTAFALSANLGKNRSLTAENMHADDLSGAAARSNFKYTDKGFEAAYARRNVSSMFSGVGTLADQDRDVLRQLMGYDQSAWSVKWQLMPALKLDLRHNDDQNSELGLFRETDTKLVEYKLDKLTSVSFQSMQNRVNDIDHVNTDQTAQRFFVSRDLGKLGKLTLSNEKATFSGAQDVLPSLDKQAVSYEANLSKSTSLSTTQSETKYSDGTRETTTANTIIQQLNPRVKVSVTDERVLRDGDKPDEAKRSFGGSIDFGKGFKLDVNQARHLNGPTEGTTNDKVSLTPGQIQGVAIESASYMHNGWDDRRDQSIGNFSFKNVNPLSFGPFKDIRFNYSADTARDNYAWQKENNRIGFGASYGQVGFGFDYFSQVAGDGFRAIDRVFNFTTDKTGKATVRGELKYGVRTLPTDQEVMIRDYSVSVRFNDHAQLVHQLVTNPLQQRGDVILGSVPVDERKNIWSFKYMKDKNFLFDMSFNEVARDAVAQSLYREAKINTTFFASNPSPVNLSYSMLQWDRNGERQTAHKFGLRYDQRPGKNQSLSFWLENLNWEHGRPANTNLQNWGLRLDYAVRF